MRDAGNVLRTIQRVRMRDAGNVLRIVFQYFTVTIPATAYNQGQGAVSHGVVTTPAVATTVTGGIAPYTYLWQYVSGSLAISITSPTGSSTTFSADVRDGVPETGVFKVTTTDANGAVVDSNNVSVQLVWTDTR
jgi:hypothetical protein